jgi:hypothetical protein
MCEYLVLFTIFDAQFIYWLVKGSLFNSAPLKNKIMNMYSGEASFVHLT